jgi:hypothetical protein
VPKLIRMAKGVLWLSVACMCVLTFVWPFAVSDDPGQPGLKIGAIAVLLLFFLSMLALLADRVARR